ncbi:MAG TPA: AI-2E family transporter [Kiritimatiellia bacterium]|nr:AI-2E family transporter [Kiritimatiellia bacterium]HMP96441.1 AI-2E family transporter [Kiritimatiellia bacterium]
MISTAFTEGQKRIIAAALTTISLVAMAVIVLWLITLILDFFRYFSGVFLPLAVAAMLATLLRPYYSWWRKLLRNTPAAVTVVMVSLVVPVVFVGYYFGVIILGQISAFLAEVPVWIENVQVLFRERLPVIQAWMDRYHLGERLMPMLRERQDALLGSAAALGQGFFSTGAAVFRSAAGMIGWVVLPIYFAYMIQAPLPGSSRLGGYLPFLKPETREHVLYLVNEFVGILVSFFRNQVIIALAQGLLFAVGFAVAGLPYGVILGLLLGLMNIVPYLGNIIGLAVVIPLAWFHPTGGLDLLIAVGVVFVAVQVIESYILTPRIMGKSTGLHPMAIIFALLFWGTAFNGLLGMILAIPLTAFLVVFWRLLKEKYIKEWL